MAKNHHYEMLYGFLLLAIAAVVSFVEAWVNILQLMQNSTHSYQSTAMLWFEISFELLYVVSLSVAAIFVYKDKLAQAAYTAVICVVLTAYTAVGNFSFVAGYAIDYSNSQKEGSLKNQALETRLSVLKGNSTAVVTVDINDKDATKWRNQIAKAEAKISGCNGKFAGNSGWFQQQRDKCKSNAVQLKMTAENNLLAYSEQTERSKESMKNRDNTIAELDKVTQELSSENERFIALPFVQLLADNPDEQIEYQRYLGMMFVTIVKLITLGCWWLGATLLKKETHYAPVGSQESQQQSTPPRPAYATNHHEPTWSNGQQSAWGAVAQSFMQPKAAAPAATEPVAERWHGESDVQSTGAANYSDSGIGFSAVIKHKRTDIPQKSTPAQVADTRMDIPAVTQSSSDTPRGIAADLEYEAIKTAILDGSYFDFEDVVGTNAIRRYTKMTSPSGKGVGQAKAIRFVKYAENDRLPMAKTDGK